MIFALLALLTIGYPPLASWARRTGGTGRLVGMAGGGLALVIALAFAATSPAFGNRLAGHEGYRVIAPRVVLFGTLTVGLPLVIMTVVVAYVGRRTTRDMFVNSAAMLAGLVTFAVSTVVAMALFWR